MIRTGRGGQAKKTPDLIAKNLSRLLETKERDNGRAVIRVFREGEREGGRKIRVVEEKWKMLFVPLVYIYIYI